jgi:hypothetical protein
MIKKNRGADVLNLGDPSRSVKLSDCISVKCPRSLKRRTYIFIDIPFPLIACGVVNMVVIVR